jgi:tetratricopeptide (TPR) repeat protein
MSCSYLSQPERQRFGNRCGAALIALAAALSWLSGAAFAQDPLPRRYDARITVGGTVRNSAGEPVADASVFLEEKGSSTPVATKTNAAGAFLLAATHAGTYSLRAAKSGFRSAVAESLTLAPEDKKHVDLVLDPLPPTNSTSAPMEFKDEPNFTVAGVTDWSNLGLHGSDTTARTSEALAKETLALKSGDPEKASTSTGKGRYDLALAYQAKGDFAQARQQVRKLLAAADEAEGHRLLGDLDEQLDDPLEAVREFEQAARMDPSEQNYFEWGSELLLHRAAKPAVEVFTKGSSAHPNSARMLAGLGAALYSVGSYDDAARRLCDAADLRPVDAAPYLFLGKIEKATSAPLPCSEEKLARFVRDQPGNALANYYYAISLQKRNKGSENPASVQQTEALLEKAVAIDPKLDEAYLRLGVLHFARGDFQPAICAYKQAIEINPSLAEAYYRLGLTYQRIGEKTKAQEEFQTYKQVQETEAAEIERQRRELRQFLIILKDQPTASSPR